jgi:penicillin-binding protein 2
MSDELKPVKDLRPDVPAPTAAAREAALERLRAAVIAEGGPDDERSHARPRGHASRWVPSAGMLVTVAASLVTVVIAVGAIVLLGHTRHPAGHSATVGQAATRGEILDQAGDVLAGNGRGIEVLVARAQLPRSAVARSAMLDRLAHILGISTRPARCQTPQGQAQLPRVLCDVEGVQSAGQKSVPVATDVSARATRELARESAVLPGVSTRATTKRIYPEGNLAGQAIGTIGDVSAAELHQPAYRGISPTSVIGQSGLEARYESELRAGDTLHTSLDAQLQKTGQQALQHAITTSRGGSGAFVAMNPQTGAVYALGSLPTFDPEVFAGHLSPSTYRKLTDPASGEPLINRAIQSAGPSGSTFKPITALAALQSGAWRTNETFDDTGQYCLGAGDAKQCRHNSGQAVDGVIDLPAALRVGSDDFFYNLGARTNADAPTAHPDGGALDQWARAFGIGQSTGIDLPGAGDGTLPTPRWRAARNRLEQECDTATGPFTGHHKHPLGGCGIADGTNRPWSIGDNLSLAVGQGDVQISPLQLAVAYAAIANGGAIIQPHLATAISTTDGSVLQTINPPAKRHLHLGSTDLQAVRTGLRDAASQPGGTSDDVFGSFPRQVYGQVGTAQYFTSTSAESDYAWYAGYVPASATSKPIVVVVWVEQGGFGDVAAAPVARQLFSQWLLGKTGPWLAGNSTAH